MLFCAIIIAAFIVFLLQAKLYSRRSFDKMEYNVYLGAEEVFEGEDVFLYEELTNNKTLPIPSARIDTSLPEGLKFRLHDTKQSSNKEVFRDYVQSVFTLKTRQKVRRRWRVYCAKRGVYSLSGAIMVTNDLMGTSPQSKRLELKPGKKTTVTVLPKTIDLEKHFTSSFYTNGDIIVRRSMLTDPLIIGGTREYTPNDPMNRINWKSTAVHGDLMVNIEEHTQRHSFNIILNMQSRPIETHPDTPSEPKTVELCITVCASILDIMSYEDIPVTVFANTTPENPDDEDMLVSRQFRGKQDMINALRMLAGLEMKITCPADKMFDRIIENPTYYSDGGNMIVISSYIDERMIIFHDILEKRGIRVIFYVTSSNQNAMVVPENIEVFYKTYIN